MNLKMRYWGLGDDYLNGLLESFTNSTDFKYFINDEDVSKVLSKTSIFDKTSLSIPYNYYKSDDELMIQLSLAGCDKDDVDVSVNKGVLSIVAERKLETFDDEKSDMFGHVKGISNGKLKKEFKLGEDIDPDSIKASMENGILTLSLSKKEESKPQKIKIK